MKYFFEFNPTIYRIGILYKEVNRPKGKYQLYDEGNNDEGENGWITATFNKISPKKEITKEQAMKLIKEELV